MSIEQELFELIKVYYEKRLGYSHEDVSQYFAIECFSEMVALKLANANVVIKNKSDKSSHQTHIAITGNTINFFYSMSEFIKMPADANYDKIDICLSERNIADLLGCLSNKNDVGNVSPITFIKGVVTLGKRTQSQVQLSKCNAENSAEFNSLREGLHEDDLLLLLRKKTSNDVIVLGISKQFYGMVISDYNTKYNSNIYCNIGGSVEDKARQEPAIEEMRCELFTEKNIDGAVNCYFCGCTLRQYMEHLPDTYREYAIQRGIVRNVYLDRLVKTILAKDNIPTITLVGDEIGIMVEGGKEYLELSKYRILDGLQRTYRIRAIWQCMQFFENIENKKSLIGMNKIKLSKLLSDSKEEMQCDVNVFLEMLSEYEKNGSIKRYWDYFNSNIQWFEVWENMTLEQETEKMLVLNAGHRQMDIRHQLELLFLNALPKLNDECVKEGGKGIIRNKEKSDMVYSKERKPGEYYFSHLISAIISYDVRKPVTTNADLIDKLQQDNEYINRYLEKFDLNELMRFMLSFDQILYERFGETGTKWISKETVLVGLFAALGKASQEMEDSFGTFLTKVFKLNLFDYEKSKNSNIEISKVNVGNVTKNAVFGAVYDLVSGMEENVNWSKYFGGMN